MKKHRKTFAILTALFSLPATSFATDTKPVTEPKAQGVIQMELSQRQSSLVQLSALTAKGDIPALKIAIEQALDQGLNLNEIKDLMVQLYTYTGFPRSLNALNALAETLQARQAKGVPTEIGPEPDRGNSNVDMLAQGTRTQTALIGQKVDLSALSADIDRYLKSHLFGDIFASDLLSWQEREIITVAALSAMQGVDSQLQAHLNISKKNGISDEQLKEIIRMAKPEMSQFPAGEENIAYAQYFVGKSYLNMLSTDQLAVGNVTFEPGTRNNWHIHHASKGGGQLLLVTAGRGYYQEWGKPAQELKAGDIVHIPAGTKHWHGAAPTEWFQHLAIEVPGENTRNQWLEPVADEDYAELK